MKLGAVVRRGTRLGVRIALVPAIIFGSVGLVAVVMWTFGGAYDDALAGLTVGVGGVGGSLAGGVLLGAVTGAVLALSPEWLAARAVLRGLVGGSAASAVFLAELLALASVVDVGPGLMILVLLAVPVVGAVAAAHSGDVLGRTHYHPWLEPSR
ncbi:hypothetical protein [Streptomyces sp. NPDC002851]